MDKMKFLIILLAFAITISSCNKSYKIDENFIFDDNHTVISSINGFIKTNKGFIIYGNTERFVRFQRLIPKGKNFGIIKLNNDGSIDSTFNNPFKIPTSICKIVELDDANYLIIYKHFKEYLYSYKMINIAIMNEKGDLQPVDFDFKKIFITDSVNEEFIEVNSIARDSSNNIYIAFSYLSSNSVLQLIKLDSTFKLDEGFQKETANKFIMGEVYSIYVQSNNQILIGGDFVWQDKLKEYKYLCRINSNGIIDSSFCQNLSEFENNDYNRICCINVIDSTIYLGGNFSLSFNNNKLSDLMRMNEDGSINLSQPNQNNIFKYVDEEPYFNKSMLLSITEVEDSLLFVSGIFNYLNNKKTDFPIAMISKNGNIVDFNFKSSTEIFNINYINYRNSDTIYIFGGNDIFEDRNQAFTRLIR